eukprot:8172-Heterococcus_DN1.PRE.2
MQILAACCTCCNAALLRILLVTAQIVLYKQFEYATWKTVSTAHYGQRALQDSCYYKSHARVSKSAIHRNQQCSSANTELIT